MDKTILHVEALRALIAVATSEQRWESQGALASDCGFTPATLSHVLSGRRGLSSDATKRLCTALGISQDALRLPALARPGDLETDRIAREVRTLVNAACDLLATVEDRGERTNA